MKKYVMYVIVQKAWAGKMINMGNNIYICPDCMQRSFDAIYNSGINYDDMMKNIPGMGNIP